MSRCADRQAKQALRALFLGELEADGLTRLRAHASGCAECQEAYDRLGRVESALEKRALPEHRQALLEQALFARLAPPARAPEPRRWRLSLPESFLPVAGGLALATVALVLVVPRMTAHEARPEFQSRGAAAGMTSAWGVRAFCVDEQGAPRAEARPGETLACGEGHSVQFSYTAPEPARLSLEATSPEGELLRFFPREGAEAEVAAGVDVVLPHSTPVRRDWLTGPLEVRARFTDAHGRELSQTRLQLSPR